MNRRNAPGSYIVKRAKMDAGGGDGVAGSGSRQMTWEHFAHGADIGVRGVGTTKSEAFEGAALALTAVLTDPDSVAVAASVEIHCEAADDEMLLVDWLNALIYEMATRDMLFGRFAVTITGNVLTATAWGEPVDRARHHPAVEAKGATYTALSLARRNDGMWVAQCVVDV